MVTFKAELLALFFLLEIVVILPTDHPRYDWVWWQDPQNMGGTADCSYFLSHWSVFLCSSCSKYLPPPLLATAHCCTLAKWRQSKLPVEWKSLVKKWFRHLNWSRSVDQTPFCPNLRAAYLVYDTPILLEPCVGTVWDSATSHRTKLIQQVYSLGSHRALHEPVPWPRLVCWYWHSHTRCIFKGFGSAVLKIRVEFTLPRSEHLQVRDLHMSNHHRPVAILYNQCSCASISCQLSEEIILREDFWHHYGSAISTH